jgi:hypothetical protein
MRLDEVSRSLARREKGGVRSADGLVLTEPVFDAVARTLATPMRRRGAIGVLSATFLAAAAWRPGTARAVTCDADEIKCTEGGREICAPVPRKCCNIPNCAAAYCREPWATCGPGYSCDDNEFMCTIWHAEGPNKLRFCSVRVDVRDSCRDTTGIAGWCCHESFLCEPTFRGCKCPSGVTCGEQCCKAGQYCETRLFGQNYCADYCGEKLNPSKRTQQCNGQCCSLTETCGIVGCVCKPGFESVGGACVPERNDPGDAPSDNAASRSLKMMRQTRSVAGGNRRWAGAQAAELPPTAAPPPAVAAALAALAAVNGQGAAAILGIRNGKRDPKFRQAVKVARVKPPTVAPGLGLDAASAAALNKYLVAQAKANALVAAMATALWRMRAARARRDAASAKRQLRAAAGFAAQASRAMNGLPALQTAAANALTQGQVAEVTVGADGVGAEIAAIKRGSYPPAVKAALAKLGVGAVDLKRLSSNLGRVPALGGGALIEPLREPSQDTQVALLLNQWSAKAKAHPIAK